MKKIGSFILCLSTIAATAQSDIEKLSDEFIDSASLKQWSFFHEAAGYPNKIKSVLVNQGKLELQPKASGWYADYQAPFLFKTITGNFDVRAKVKISGTNNILPTVDWSLAGLMVRQPAGTNKANWRPHQENWLFITTGVAEQTDLSVFEVKSTNNSLSNLKLRPARTGWVELRIVRIDAAFILLARYEGEPWQVLERFYRPVMRGPLQVGLNAYSSWNAVPESVKADPALFNETVLDIRSDLLLQVDYIRLKRPVINETRLSSVYNAQYAGTLFYTPGNLLTDFSISNEEVLKIIGD